MQSDSSRTVSQARISPGEKGGADKPTDLPSGTQAVVAGFFDALFEHSTVGIAVHDRELRYIAANERLAQIDRLPVEQHIGRTVGEILGETALMVEPILKQVFETGKSVLDTLIVGHLPGEFPTRRIVSYFPIVKDGVVDRVGGLIREVPEEAKFREELLESAIRLIRKAVESSGPDNDSTSFTRLPDDRQNLLPFSHSFERESGSAPEDHDRELSSRQSELVRLLANSKSNKEIANMLGLTVKTVATYREKIMLKLDIHTMAELTLYAVRTGLVKP